MDEAVLKQGRGTGGWRIVGDWFDVCSCNVPCPCTFAQPPTGETCDVIFAYRIRTGHYDEISLAGLNVVLVATLTGNSWEGGGLDAGVFFDASANADQREALELIFTGQVGGWMGSYVPTALGGLRGIETADISIEIDDSLERWRVEIPEVLRAAGEALTGPTADPTRRVQTLNPPGSEVGPTTAAVTWGKSVEGRWRAFGFSQDIPRGQNSKHIPFEWSGPCK